MGTDIHVRIEVLFEGDSTYTFIGNGQGDRHYDLFGVLSGVRSDNYGEGFFLIDADNYITEELAKEHNCSPELCEEIKDSWGGCGHDFSIATLGQLKSLSEIEDDGEDDTWSAEIREIAEGSEQLHLWIELMEALKTKLGDAIQETRVVFWYDS